VSSRESVSLADILFEDSPLSRRQAIHLAQLWTTEIRTELETTGVSVVAGLGTLSSGTEGLSFKADPGLNLMFDLPPVEGHSEHSATAAIRDSDADDVHGTVDSRYSSSGVLSTKLADLESSQPISVEKEDVGDDSSVELQDETEQASQDATSGLGSGSEAHIDSEIHSEPDASDSESEDEWSASFSAAVSKADKSISEQNDNDEQGNESGLEATNASDSTTTDSTTTESVSDTDTGATMQPSEASQDGSKDQGADSPSDLESLAPAKPSSQRSLTPRTSRRRRVPNSSRNEPNSRAIYAILGVFAVIVLAAFIYRFGFPSLTPEPSSSPAIASADSSSSTEPAAAEVDTDSLAASNTGSDPNVDSGDGDGDKGVEGIEATSEAEPNSPAAPDNNEQTLAAFSLTTESEGYMLVVGSSLNRQYAESSLRQYSSIGLPMGVLEYQNDGLTRYRMGLGVFPTIASADSARQVLNPQLPEGTWVWPIR